MVDVCSRMVDACARMVDVCARVFRLLALICVVKYNEDLISALTPRNLVGCIRPHCVDVCICSCQRWEKGISACVCVCVCVGSYMIC